MAEAGAMDAVLGGPAAPPSANGELTAMYAIASGEYGWVIDAEDVDIAS